MITIIAACPACHQELPIELDEPPGRDRGIVVTCDHCGVTRSLRAYRREYARQIVAQNRRRQEEAIAHATTEQQRLQRIAAQAANAAREAALRTAAAALAERANPAPVRRTGSAGVPWRNRRGLKTPAFVGAGAAVLALVAVTAFWATRTEPVETGAKAELPLPPDIADWDQPQTSDAKSAAESHYDLLRAMAQQLSARDYRDANGRQIDTSQALGMVIGGAGRLCKPGALPFEIEWRLNAGLTGADPVSSLTVGEEGRRYGEDLFGAARNEWAGLPTAAGVAPDGFVAAGVEVLETADQAMRDGARMERPNEYGWQYCYVAEKRLGDYFFKCTIRDTIESDIWETKPGSRIVLEFTFDPDVAPDEPGQFADEHGGGQ